MPDNKEPVAQPAASSKPESKESEEQYVSRKAYEQMQADMHKFKQEKKDAEAAKNEYEAKLKQIEEEKLKDQEQWKTLYEQAQQEKEVFQSKFKERESQYLDTFRRMELKRELGGIKDAYLVHADLTQIEYKDDGTIDRDSVLRVANKFREEHGELLPKAAEKDPTGSASPTNASIHSKSINEMTYAEKLEAYRKLKSS